MFCERCGNPVGDTEKFCSKCGAPLSPVTTTAPAESAAPEPTTETAAPVESTAPVAPAVPVGNQDNSGKGRKKKIVPLIAGCAVLVAVIVCVANGAKLGNFFSRTFSSPEKYYQYVEKTTVEEMAELGSACYEALVMDTLSTDNRSASAEFTVALGKGGQDLVNLLGLAGVDLSWFTELSVGAGFSLKDDVFGYDLSFGMNKSDILSANMVADLKEGNMYLRVPELTAEYIGFDMEEFIGVDWIDEFEEYLQTQEELKGVQRAMPDAKEVEKLMQKYLNLALSSVNNVDKSQKTLKVEGVRQKCTELEVTFDGESLAEMLEVILTEMQKDKDLKKLIVKTVDGLIETGYFESYSRDGEDFYDAFQEKLEEMLDRMDSRGDREEPDVELIMKVYVDGKGNIVGRIIELVEDGENYLTVNLLMPENGSRFGYEFSVKPGYGAEIALTGSGKKSGNKLSGDFSLEYMGISLLDLQVSKLDQKQLEQGYLNGSFTITPSKMVSMLLTGNYYGSAYASMFTDMQLTLDSQMSKDSGKITLGLLHDEEEMVSISMSVKTGDGSGASVPGANKTIFVEDVDDLEDWLDGIDWESFIEKLDKAGLPDEVVDLVEEIADTLEYTGIEGLFFDLYNDYDMYNNDYYGW